MRASTSHTAQTNKHARLTLTSLLCLIALSTPSTPRASTIDTPNSIHFIAAPYLHALHYNNQHQASILSHIKSSPELCNHHWQMVVTSIPDGFTRKGDIDLLDHDKHALFRLSTDHRNIEIPLPINTQLQPLYFNQAENTPLWIHYNYIADTTWHTPILTPRIAAQVLAAQQRTQQMAEHMADRAFYFGYDTNDNALQ